MALDKLVDSAQLDSDLTSVANAIRTKGGTSGSLAFPAGFVSAVESIETGGGETFYDSHGALYKEYMEIPSTVSTIRYVREAYQNATHLVSFVQQYGTPSIDADYGLFRGCSALETVWVARGTFGNYCFAGCTNLKHITLGRVGLPVTSVPINVFSANGGSFSSIEDITVFVDATDLSGVPSAVKDRIIPTNSHGAVVTYKNYQSGDTIATVTVE